MINNFNKELKQINLPFELVNIIFNISTILLISILYYTIIDFNLVPSNFILFIILLMFIYFYILFVRKFYIFYFLQKKHLGNITKISLSELSALGIYLFIKFFMSLREGSTEVWTCGNCGFILRKKYKVCPNCQNKIFW